MNQNFRMNYDKVEKWVNTGIWITIIILVGGSNAAILYAGHISDKEIDKLMTKIACVALTVFPLAFMLFINHLRSRLRNKMAQPLLEELQKKWGGTIKLPTAFLPAIMPRLETTVLGHRLQVVIHGNERSLVNQWFAKTIETPTASFAAPAVDWKQLILGFKRWRFFITIYWDKPVPFVLSTFRKSKIQQASLNKFLKTKLQELPFADAKLNELCLYYCDDVTAGQKFLADPNNLLSLDEILCCNEPFVTKLEGSKPGFIFYSLFSKNFTTSTIARLIEDLKNLQTG